MTDGAIALFIGLFKDTVFIGIVLILDSTLIDLVNIKSFHIKYKELSEIYLHVEKFTYNELNNNEISKS